MELDPTPLKSLLAACQSGAFPILSAFEENRLEHEHQHLRKLLASGIPIYGGNRRPGHREIEAELSEQALSRDILESHAIGEAPWYDSLQIRSISVAKLAMWRAGGSGVSVTMFNRVAALLADESFRPLVPRCNTYSAGDVIPAAHWAQAILEGSPKTGRHEGTAEIMTLLNGAFIHAGLALMSISQLRDAWILFFENTVAFMQNLRNNSFLRCSRIRLAPAAIDAVDALRFLTTNISPVTGLQDSISIRATDEIFETLLEAVDRMAQRLTETLHRPSCNPLINEHQNTGISQASFFLPALAVAQGALIDAILFTMWAQVGRTTYFLSGDIATIPVDGATSECPLGLIQHPKQMMALLEEARSVAGRLIYSSGGSTSHGIEDIWSHGVTVTDTLTAVCECFFKMSSIEACVLQHLRKSGLISENTVCDIGVASLASSESPLKPASVRHMVTERMITDPNYPRYGFPVQC